MTKARTQRLIEYITTLWKGQGNPIRVSMICNPRRGMPSRGCCKSWTRGWDSLVPSIMWWLIIFLPRLLFLINNPISMSFGWFVAFESINIFRVIIDWNCNFMGLLYHPIWLKLNLTLFGASLFNFWNYFVWLRITDEGSVPKMRIWSILLITSD